jgi:hypothetical protein
MLTFILVSGFLALIGLAWAAYRLTKAAAQEQLDDTKIANVGDLNYNNPMGKWGLDGF